MLSARAFTALGQLDRARKSIEVLEQRGFTTAALRERMASRRASPAPRARWRSPTQSRLDLADPSHLDVLEQVVDLSIEAKRSAAALARIDRALERSPKSPRLFEYARDRARRARARRRRARRFRARARAGFRERARQRGARGAAREGRRHEGGDRAVRPRLSARAARRRLRLCRGSARARIRRRRRRGGAAARDRPPPPRGRGRAQRSRLAAGPARRGARFRARAGGGGAAPGRLARPCSTRSAGSTTNAASMPMR